MPRTIRSITVQELREALEDFKPEDIVVFSHDYGDHCHTQAVGRIENIKMQDLVETAYSDSGFAVKDDESQREPVARAVVIS